MTDKLAALRRANPALPLYSVHDPAFAPYGRVLAIPDAAPLSAALAATEIPAEGNRYLASDPGLEACAALDAPRRAVFGGLDTQSGFCNGRGFTLNALEYHKGSELNYTTTGLVLLLALPEQLRDGALDTAEVAGFWLPPETAVEIFPRTLHFAPCRTDAGGFNCLVVLEKGVNAPLDSVDPAAPGEEKLLWMRGKWLLCHPDSPQAAKGAYVGLRGENLTLKL